MIPIAFTDQLPAIIGLGVIALVIGAVAGALLARKFESARRKSEQSKAQDVINAARGEADRIKKDAELSAKDEFFKRKESFEGEAAEIRRELKELDRRLSKREDNLERKVDLLNRKEKQLEQSEQSITQRTDNLKARESELGGLIEEQKQVLLQTAGMTRDEAVAMLLGKLETEVADECSNLIQRRLEEAEEVVDKEARNLLSTAIERLAAEHTSDIVVSGVGLPNDEMKGRIIGRDGRNIRAFEKATGVDVIVDDTPGVIVISAADNVRREIARRAMERLVTDGRIHPARIEEVAAQTEKDVEREIVEMGQQACYDVNIHDINKRIVNLLGRLHYRTSYGQNVMKHSLEVAHLCGVMAGEMGIDVKLAQRCGLLHDIGKALDSQTEGGHPTIGADFARKYGEGDEVVNAIASHHEDVPKKYIYSVFAKTADAISASRPGARRETLEKYLKRMEKLEEIAGEFGGVAKAYAIQAGREVRVIVDADKVSDDEAMKVARDIAKKIESEMTYPGEVKVTLLRETRVIEYAR